METQIFLESLMNASPDAVTFVDADGNIALFNPEAENLTGYKSAEVLNTPVKNLYNHPEDVFRIWGFLESKGVCHNVETFIKCKNGTVVPISMSIAKVMDNNGKLIGTVGISRDLRDYKELEKKVVSLERMAACSALAAETAHQINNPLEIIKNYAFLLGMKTSEDESKQWLKIIESEIFRIAQIVRDLTTLTFTQPKKMERIDPNTFLLTIQDLVMPWLIQKNISLNIKTQKEGKSFNSSNEHLRQIFIDVILIAMKVMPNGGKITIETQQDTKVMDFVICLEVPYILDNSLDRKQPGIMIDQYDMAGTYGIIKNLGGELDIKKLTDRGVELRIQFGEHSHYGFNKW